MNTDGRVVIWFSCGAASACAAKLSVIKYPDAHVVYCDTLASEHPDNLRFLTDVEAWIEKTVEIISSHKYRDIEEVFDKIRYMSGVAGAPCTREMKKIPRLEYQLPNDLHIFGLTAEETNRIKRFEKQNPDLELEWVLRDAGLTKEGCYDMLRNVGIPLPAMYSLGFKNNNCIGCVKSTSPTYWDRVRKNFPEIFKRRCVQSREIGCRLIEYHGKRLFLDELPDPITDKRREKNIECGVVCITEAK